MIDRAANGDTDGDRSRPTSLTEPPGATIAAGLAGACVGGRPSGTRRFSIGSSHYVFEVFYVDRPSVVVRMARRDEGAAMVGAVALNRMLRPLGVPLPALLFDGSQQPVPHLVLQRLPGVDLGAVIETLSDAALEGIAAKVAAAQAIVAELPAAGRYGYSVHGDDAPHEAWSKVLIADLQRSRRRIAAAGLFDVEVVGAVLRLIAAARAELDLLPATPFLHDTTTKNVIVTVDGAFSGIVDVDDLCFGDPRYAPALTLAAVLAFGGPVRYVDAWMKLAGHADDRIFRLYVAMFLVGFMSEQGQAFNGNQAPSSGEDRESLLRIFSAALSRAGGQH